MRFLRFAIVVMACAACGGCGADAAIRWEPEVRGPGAMAPGARMVLTAAGIPAVQTALEPFRRPKDSLTCASTRVAVSADGESQAVVWWRSSPRAGGATPGSVWCVWSVGPG